MDLEQPCEEGSRNSGEQDAWMPVKTHCLDASRHYVLTGQKANHILSYIKSSVTQQGETRDYSLLLCFCKTPTRMQHLGLEAPAEECHRSLKAGPWAGHKTSFL